MGVLQGGLCGGGARHCSWGAGWGEGMNGQRGGEGWRGRRGAGTVFAIICTKIK